MSEICLYTTNKTKETLLNVWCAFPAVYNFGMSALGFLAVAKYIDSIDGIYAERIFTDTEKTYLKKENVDVITFSFSFEMDYLGILGILKKLEMRLFLEHMLIINYFLKMFTKLILMHLVVLVGM